MTARSPRVRASPSPSRGEHGGPAFGRTIIVTFRRDLLNLLTIEPRSVSSLARDLGLTRRDIEDDLRHLIRSARAQGHTIIVEPARCRSCGFTFNEEKLVKPGKCPACRGTRMYEAQIRIERGY